MVDNTKHANFLIFKVFALCFIENEDKNLMLCFIENEDKNLMLAKWIFPNILIDL